MTAGLACGSVPMQLLYDLSEDREKRVERFEESERGWMMLFLVSRPKLTAHQKERAKQNVSLVTFTK